MPRQRLVFLLAVAACASQRGGPTPVPSAVAPNIICTAQSATTVTLTGTDFSPAVVGALTDDPTVEMPGVVFSAGGTDHAAAAADVSLPGGDRSGTKLAVVIPMGSLGPLTSDLAPVVYDVEVTNPNGHAGTLAQALTVVPPPSLTAIAPSSGAADSLVDFTLAGAGFRAGMTVTLDVPNAPLAATGVTVGSVTAASGTFNLTGVAAGTYGVTVKNSEGCSFTLPNAFTVYIPKIIVVSAIDPPFGCACAPTTVTISSPSPGGFRSTPIVELSTDAGGAKVALSRVAFVNETSLTAVVPAGLALGDYDVIVTNPPYDGGRGTLNAGFRVVAHPVPIVTAVEPPGATTQESPTVKVLGANFRSTVKVELIGAASPTPVLTRAGLTPKSDGEVDVPIAASGLTPAPYLVRVWDEDEATYFTFSAFLVTNPAGKLETFRTEAAMLPFGVQFPAGASADDDLGNHYIYVVSGANNVGPISQVEMSQLGRFGALGAWKLLPNSLIPGGRAGGAAVTVAAGNGRSYVYLLGGNDAMNGPSRSVLGAVVLRTSDAPANLAATPMLDAGTLAAGTWYYKVSAMGGDPDNPGGESLASDEAIVTLARDGSVALSWDAVPGATAYNVYRTSLVNGRSQEENKLSFTSKTSYTDDGKVTITVTSPYQPDGALGKWQEVSSMLTTPRWGHQAALVRDAGGAQAVVVLGGKSALSGAVLSSVERAAVDPDTGALGAFTSSGTTAMSPGRAFFSLSVGTSGNSKLKGAPARLWVSGGIDPSGQTLDTVAYSDVGSGGGNSAWTQVSKTTNSKVAGLMSVITNNTIFMLGGAGSVSDGGTLSFGGVTGDGRQMQLDNMGGEGNSISSTSSALLSPRAFGVVVQGSGFIYFIGGSSGLGLPTSVESTF